MRSAWIISSKTLMLSTSTATPSTTSARFTSTISQLKIAVIPNTLLMACFPLSFFKSLFFSSYHKVLKNKSPHCPPGKSLL